MEGYRHLNVLISGKTYDALKEASYELRKPVSEIVRQGVARILRNPSCQCEDTKNADN